MITIEKNEQITNTFMIWLVDELQKEIIANSNLTKFRRLTAESKQQLGKHINIEAAFIYLVINLTYLESENNYVILIPQNLNFEGISSKTLLAYINFGNLQINGYPIIQTILSETPKKLNRYLLKYNMVGMI